MTNTLKRDPLLRGPFPWATIAAMAGAAERTVREWGERGFVNACEMWPQLYGAKAATAAAKRQKRSKGPEQRADVEALQICALAELARNGVTPAYARHGGRAGGAARTGSSGTYLLDALTRELAVRAFLVPAAGDREPLGPHEEGGDRTRYLVAELRNRNASPSLRDLTAKELTTYFADDARTASAVWIVIDCDALLRRILDRLVEVRGGEEPAP